MDLLDGALDSRDRVRAGAHLEGQRPLVPIPGNAPLIPAAKHPGATGKRLEQLGNKSIHPAASVIPGWAPAWLSPPRCQHLEGSVFMGFTL